ncbi:MAG: hypothetical protein WB607_10550 [Candidatus Acidiferrum sp.]
MWKHNEDRIRSIRHRNVGFLLAGTRSRRCANKSKCAKPQNTLVLGEDAVKDLLLLMEPDKNGKISKQAWMRFMAEEFDRLDNDNKGELDAQELRRSHLLIKHASAQDVGMESKTFCGQ